MLRYFHGRLCINLGSTNWCLVWRLCDPTVATRICITTIVFPSCIWSCECIIQFNWLQSDNLFIPNLINGSGEVNHKEKTWRDVVIVVGCGSGLLSLSAPLPHCSGKTPLPLCYMYSKSKEESVVWEANQDIIHVLLMCLVPLFEEDFTGTI